FAPVFVIIFKDGKRQVKYLEPSYLKPHINNFQLCKFDIVMSDEKAKFLYEQYKDVWNKNYKA
ncbi:MAG: hypothetical protein KDD29_07000, partial [Flavobacteriales bacterium]|nr:hypothetical protein [Flavobacteriales bacterium]